MSSSTVVTATDSLAMPATETQADPAAGGDAAKRRGTKGTAVLATVMLLLMLAAAVWGYTQWWAPRQEAQAAAQLKYTQCLDEVQAYAGTPSYEHRVAQCESQLAG